MVDTFVRRRRSPYENIIEVPSKTQSVQKSSTSTTTTTATAMMESPRPRSVLIIGGSLAGLMHALALLTLPNPPEVRILERSPTALLHNQGAGVVAGKETQDFFDEYVRAGKWSSLSQEDIGWQLTQHRQRYRHHVSDAPLSRSSRSSHARERRTQSSAYDVVGSALSSTTLAS